MRLRALLLGLAVSLPLCVSPAGADGPVSEFVPLGDLAGGVFMSRATAVSGDGLVVVGESVSADGTEAFRWTRAGGMVGLGDLPGGSFASGARGVDADGTVVVGSSQSAASAPIGHEAFRWTAAEGMQPLGDLPGNFYASSASGCDTGGTLVIGHSSSAASLFNAMKWTEGGGMETLGDLPGGVFFSVASAASNDGNVIVGQGKSGDGTFAARWVGGQISSLGALPVANAASNAHDCSPGGTWIVGSAKSADGQEAVRWRPDLTIEGLGNLPGGNYHSMALGVSADGSVVVGSANTNDGQRAMLWTEADGMQLLTDALALRGVMVPTGWQLWSAVGVSDDGTVIAGSGFSPSGVEEGWVVVLGEPPVIEATGLLVTKVTVGINGRKPHKSSLKVVGQCDLGVLPKTDLSRPVTIRAGAFELTTGALRSTRKGWRWSDDAANFLFTPSATGSSAAKFDLKFKGDLEGRLPQAGDLTVTLLTDWGTSIGTVQIERGKYRWNRRVGPGALAAPGSHMVTAFVKLGDVRAKSLELTSCLGPGGRIPANAPDFTIEFHGWTATVPATFFERRNTGYRFRGNMDGLTSVTLDYTKKEAVTVNAKDLPLGAFTEGANALTTRIIVGGVERTMNVQVVRKGKKVRY